MKESLAVSYGKFNFIFRFLINNFFFAAVTDPIRSWDQRLPRDRRTVGRRHERPVSGGRGHHVADPQHQRQQQYQGHNTRAWDAIFFLAVV